MRWAQRAGTLLIATVLTISVAGVSNSQVRYASNTVVVGYDRGGSIVDYAKQVAELKRQNAVVQFAGNCDSACTLFLALSGPRSCIRRGASFGFHKASGASSSANNWGTHYLMRHYPYWVRQWISANGGMSHNIKRMGYRYASRYMPTC